MKTTGRPAERSAKEFAGRNPDTDIFLVGGAVRDRILGRRAFDFDFAVSRNEEDLARHFEREGFGRAVRISPESSPFPVWRLTRGGVTVDVARFEVPGPIERDLRRRDFTVDAIARDVRTGRLSDPCGGVRDLRRRRLVMISRKNLDDDPIRILRAYRLASALGFTIELRTRAALRRRAPSLRDEAPERVHAELVRLFESPRAASAIGRAEVDGVLAASLGLLTPAPRRVAPAIAPFDGLRKDPSTRLVFRLAALFFRWPLPSDQVRDVLASRGFARREIAGISAGVRFLESAFSRAPAERVLFSVRDHWKEMRTLLRLAARRPPEIARAREVHLAARRCRFDPAPVSGRDIGDWSGLRPGRELGAEIERARFLYFTGRVASRAELEACIRAFDRSGSVG